MRRRFADALEAYRVAGVPHDANGHFLRKGMSVRTSNGGGWDHVSVSFKTRCPTWEEMCKVKSWCFEDEEAVMQLHPPASNYRCFHNFCLHLWRPQTTEEIAEVKADWIASGDKWPDEYHTTGAMIPLPPGMFVAPEFSMKMDNGRIMTNENGKFEQWAIVDVMGHQRYIGRVTEQVIAGCGFVRVDIPKTKDVNAWSKLIGTGSIYAITPVEKDIAVAMAERQQQTPIEPYELTAKMIAEASTPRLPFDETDDWE